MSVIQQSNNAQEPSIQAYQPSSQNISVTGRHFVDETSRTLNLRGVNVGGASKVYVLLTSAVYQQSFLPLGGTDVLPSPREKLPLHRHRETSYVDRPFKLDEADEHWKRLKSWGLTFGTSRRSARIR
jgi:hypothetical protein